MVLNTPTFNKAFINCLIKIEKAPTRNKIGAARLINAKAPYRESKITASLAVKLQKTQLQFESEMFLNLSSESRAYLCELLMLEITP